MTRRLFCGLAIALVAAAARPPAAAAAAPARELVVEAELVDPPQPAPAPGTARIVSLARYRIVKVVKGKYAHAEILVGFDGVAGLPSKAGERDRLVLTSRFPRDAGLLNPFGDEVKKLGMFYCTRLEAAP